MAVAKQALDHPSRDPHPDQLRARHHPVLPACQIPNPPSKLKFGSHADPVFNLGTHPPRLPHPSAPIGPQTPRLSANFLPSLQRPSAADANTRGGRHRQARAERKPNWLPNREPKPKAGL